VDRYQPTVLIVSNDEEFSHAITTRWKCERSVPAFTLMSGDLCPGLNSEGFDVAIVGCLTPATLRTVMKAVGACRKPVLLIREPDQPVFSADEGLSRVITLTRVHGLWLDATILILSETLRTSLAAAEIRGLEQTNAVLARDAALGRYMLEMRHSLNNALTSVLGNSELLLLDPEALAPVDAKIRAQVDTIRNMSLRMHEILQRFSSLEKELHVAEQQAANEIKTKTLAAAASS
jgi:signal transduction histidine kinase